MNFYTASEADLASIEKVWETTAKKLLNLRNEVRIGTRPPVTVKDLAEVRLPVAEWQGKSRERNNLP